MIDINTLRDTQHKIITIGNHPGIIQSMLDFDFLSGRESPQIVGIVGSSKAYERYFFGKKEILLSGYKNIQAIPPQKAENVTLFVSVRSARRVLGQMAEIFDYFPNLLGGVIFAENIPEKQALELSELAKEKGKFLIGPASVGILLPQILKLGAIGGVDIAQLVSSRLFTKGSLAVFSSSGGMTNEIITQVVATGHRISFALHFGGDRFPVTTPKDAFLMAQDDPDTKAIIYFGELGGVDEYEIATLIKDAEVTKPVVCYIAGSISEYFETPPQFGHAKAMAKSEMETAKAKQEALSLAGASVAKTFGEFVQMIKNCEASDITEEKEYTSLMDDVSSRKSSLITSSIAKEEDGEVLLLNTPVVTLARDHSFAYIVSSLFLGREIKSKETEEVIDFILKLLVDHGPHVSGAMNTIVSARAGKDLVSSLASGLLTIGPRFGGAVNIAAENWLRGVTDGGAAEVFVESYAQRNEYILGIGHKKYRIDLPDPRVKELLTFVQSLDKKEYTSFALSVEKITTSKKGNLILNIDGAIAAVLLDVLAEKEGYTKEQLKQLVDTEFFNGLFVLSRSVGFISHFVDQKRLDEGLLRLPDELVGSVDIQK